MKIIKIIKMITAALIYISVLSAPNLSAESLTRSFAWPLETLQLDPHNTSSDTRFSLIAHYLSPLVDIDPEDNSVIPALAEKWSVSDDGKTITLHLRKDAVWSDGTRLTAQQAKQSIERALSPGMASDAQAMLSPIVGAQARLDGKIDTPLGIEVPDSETIIFSLVRNQPDFLRVLAFPIASPVPIHQLDANLAYPQVESLSSSGPYRLVDTSKHTAEFRVNETYYGERPHFTSVTFHFGEYKELIKHFLQGAYDTVEYISIDQMPWLKSNMPEAIEVVQHNGAFYLVLKHEDLGGLDLRARQLLLASLDYNRLNKVMTRNVFSGVSGLIPWGPPLAKDTEIASESRHFAVKGLTELMEKRGYSQENPLEICVRYRKTDAFNGLVNFLQGHLKVMHIKLSLQKNEFSQILKKGGWQTEDLCQFYIDGFSSRTRSKEEIIQAFLSGVTAFSPYLKNQSALREKSSRMSQLMDVTERKAAVDDLEDHLLTQGYARAIYKTDLINLVKQQRIANYKESKTFHFIPLSQHLKPLK